MSTLRAQIVTNRIRQGRSPSSPIKDCPSEQNEKSAVGHDYWGRFGVNTDMNSETIYWISLVTAGCLSLAALQELSPRPHVERPSYDTSLLVTQPVPVLSGISADLGQEVGLCAVVR
jgi:hypothetical protein